MAVRQCVPNACGEASVNPTSALRFDATAFGEWWSQLLFCFQSYVVFFHWQALSWTTQGKGYWETSLFLACPPIAEGAWVGDDLQLILHHTLAVPASWNTVPLTPTYQVSP